MLNPLEFFENEKPIHIDSWIPETEDLHFTNTKDRIILSISKFYNIEPKNIALDSFIMNTKRCYNHQDLRNHTCHYLNYFEKYYDIDKELISVFMRMKYLMDYEPMYNEEAFMYDIRTYLYSQSILMKLDFLARDNYILDLKYKNNTNESIIYDNTHGYILMKISFLFNMAIPLLTHFSSNNNENNTSDIIMNIYDHILSLYDDVDIYNKLYETTISIINNSVRRDVKLWDQQDIRGKNATTHAIETVKSLFRNVVPKYVFNQNIISFNFSSILNGICFNITDQHRNMLGPLL